jgi:hypothetical protein
MELDGRTCLSKITSWSYESILQRHALIFDKPAVLVNLDIPEFFAAAGIAINAIPPN